MSTNAAATYGYTCTTCGQWVTSGTAHSCGGSPIYPPSYIPPTIVNTFIDERLIALLERIAAALEKDRA